MCVCVLKFETRGRDEFAQRFHTMTVYERAKKQIYIVRREQMRNRVRVRKLQ